MRIGSSRWAALIIEGAKTFGIALNQKQISRFAVHAGELLKWNKKFNLTSITDPRDMALKHYLDSIVPAKRIQPFSALLDIGSGGGFPGIPLKIVCPSLRLTLLDGSRKKINFLKHTLRSLDLDDVEARQTRAEQLDDNPDLVSAFDVIVSRALSSLDAFVQMALPLLAEEGMIIAWRGKVAPSEIDAVQSDILEKLNGDRRAQRQYSLVLKTYKLPVLEAERTLLCIKIFTAK
jgi:16S rRNA (guanine527-N7)-methyltransferase